MLLRCLGALWVLVAALTGPAFASPGFERAALAVAGIARAAGDVGPCSAVFVAADVALTARHCILGDDRARPTDFVVVSRAGRHPVVGYAVAATSPVDGTGRLVAPQHDWIELRVSGPAAPALVAVAGRAGLVLAASGDGLVKRGWGTEAGRCVVLDVAMTEGAFAFRCPGGGTGALGPGRSGSPLFVVTHAGVEAVGIHVAAATLAGRRFGIAVLLRPELPEG